MKEPDPLLHYRLRLAVMSILMNVEEADFVYLREKTEATAGNLSVQLDKLSAAGYIAGKKGFAGKRPAPSAASPRRAGRPSRNTRTRSGNTSPSDRASGADSAPTEHHRRGICLAGIRESGERVQSRYASSCTPATARPLGSFLPLKEASHARASAVEQATLGTLGTLRAALLLGKCSSKMLR